MSPVELQANAKAESASVVMKPPWQMSKPFSMSSRTGISRKAAPSEIATMRMPIAFDARSLANMWTPTASAVCCAVECISHGTSPR